MIITHFNLITQTNLNPSVEQEYLKPIDVLFQQNQQDKINDGGINAVIQYIVNYLDVEPFSDVEPNLNLNLSAERVILLFFCSINDNDYGFDPKDDKVFFRLTYLSDHYKRLADSLRERAASKPLESPERDRLNALQPLISHYRAVELETRKLETFDLKTRLEMIVTVFNAFPFDLDRALIEWKCREFKSKVKLWQSETGHLKSVTILLKDLHELVCERFKQLNISLEALQNLKPDKLARLRDLIDRTKLKFDFGFEYYAFIGRPEIELLISIEKWFNLRTGVIVKMWDKLPAGVKEGLNHRANQLEKANILKSKVEGEKSYFTAFNQTTGAQSKPIYNSFEVENLFIELSKEKTVKGVISKLYSIGFIAFLRLDTQTFSVHTRLHELIASWFDKEDKKFPAGTVKIYLLALDAEEKEAYNKQKR